MWGEYIGKITQGALPNIKGDFTLRGNANTASGAFLKSAGVGVGAGTGNVVEQIATYYFNANTHNVIYGGGWYDGDRVVPASVGVMFIIKY